MAWQRVSTVSEVHPALARGSAGFEIVPELRPRDSEAVFDKIMDVNVKGPFELAKRCFPSMQERGGGSIINISSIGGISPEPLFACRFVYF